MQPDVIAFELALSMYFISAIAGTADLFKKTNIWPRLLFVSAGAGFVFHTISTVYRFAIAGHPPIVSPHEATAFFAWCIVLMFFVVEIRYRLGLFGSFIMPLVFFMAFTAAMLPREFEPLQPLLQSKWLLTHTFLAFLGNAAFALACMAGVMYLVQEHYLKSKHMGDLFGRLPSIQTLDHLNYRLITIAFPLFTLAIISGMAWAKSSMGNYLALDFRTVWAMVTWLIYALILHARLVAGWRGRRASVLSIVGFISVLLAFFGVKLLQKGFHIF